MAQRKLKNGKKKKFTPRHAREREAAQNFLDLRIEREQRTRKATYDRSVAFVTILSKASATFKRSELYGTVKKQTLVKHYKALMKAEAPA